MQHSVRQLGRAFVHSYQHPAEPWQLAIATLAEEGSGKLSLGGFRIAPRTLVEEPGFDADRMAADLAAGMEEKVYWSRVIRVGGPLALRDSNRIVGGKCVLRPSDDSRVGMPRDRGMLDWAIECLQEFDRRTGIHVVTGQDLGHGTMSDGVTGSLDYMARRCRGCVDADTSKPTGEGNFYLLKGMLAGLGIELEGAVVGIIGIGNIGMHVLERLHEHGARVIVLEVNAERRAAAERLGARVCTPDQKLHFLEQPMAALTVSANKESLDPAAIRRIVANPAVRVVCGSENLAMPDPRGAEELRAAGKLYAPTEMGGMMGYLTAVEEYLALLEGVPFDVSTLFEAAKRLEEAGRKAATHVRQRGYDIAFEDAVREIYSV